MFRDRKSEIPDDKILVPGVVDTTTNFVEHPELVAQRIGMFVNIVGADRVIAGSDCGFGTFAGFGAVDPGIAFAKLRTLAEGASDCERSFELAGLGDSVSNSIPSAVCYPFDGRAGVQVGAQAP